MGEAVRITNEELLIPNQSPMSNAVMIKKYDLEERTGTFGLNIISFAKLVPINTVSHPLVSQLVRSGTSVGSNYCEADDAESRKDFIHKIGICKKEARETKHWLKMLQEAFPEFEKDIEPLLQEAQELNLIFNAIVYKTRENICH